jgi:hypothetical protein
VDVIIDDHLLREVLLEGEPAWLRRRRRGGRLSTTGSWYYRLCSALQSPEVAGALSGPITALPDDLRAAVMQRVVALPASIGLRSLRDLAWPASGLGRRYGLNLLAAEALAAAVELRAAIATTEANLPPKLAAAARAEGVRLLAAG